MLQTMTTDFHRLTGTLEIALNAAALGYHCLPCWPSTKKPAVKWKQFQSVAPTEGEYRDWFADPRTNIAIITSGLVVFDCDDPAMAEHVRANCGDTPHQLQTPRGGFHLGYRAPVGVVVGNRVMIRGLAIDIRAENGLEMLPPSTTSDGAYEWIGPGLLPASKLPEAQIEWTREEPLRIVSPLVVDGSIRSIHRARAYLARMEGAIAGERGHDRTFRAACTLTQKFGLNFDEAWPLLLEWNERCEPPWSLTELEHKLHDALRTRESRLLASTPQGGRACIRFAGEEVKK